MLKSLSLILVGLALFIFIGLIFGVVFIVFYKRLSNTFKKLYDSVKNKIFYNVILRTSIQSYFDTAISTWLAFQVFYGSPSFSTNILITLATIIYMVIYPWFTKYIVKRYGEDIRLPKVDKSIGTLYLNQDKYKLKSCQEYHMWFMYRRFLFTMAIVFISKEYVIIQIGFCASLSLIVTSYLIQTQPMTKQHHNFLAVYNELTVYCGCIFMIAFTDFILSPEARHEHGYHFLYWLGSALVCVNFSFLLFDLLFNGTKKSKQKFKQHK